MHLCLPKTNDLSKTHSYSLYAFLGGFFSGRFLDCRRRLREPGMVVVGSNTQIHDTPAVVGAPTNRSYCLTTKNAFKVRKSSGHFPYRWVVWNGGLDPYGSPCTTMNYPKPYNHGSCNFLSQSLELRSQKHKPYRSFQLFLACPCFPT